MTLVKFNHYKSLSHHSHLALEKTCRGKRTSRFIYKHRNLMQPQDSVLQRETETRALVHQKACMKSHLCSTFTLLGHVFLFELLGLLTTLDRSM